MWVCACVRVYVLFILGCRRHVRVLSSFDVSVRLFFRPSTCPFQQNVTVLILKGFQIYGLKVSGVMYIVTKRIVVQNDHAWSIFTHPKKPWNSRWQTFWWCLRDDSVRKSENGQKFSGWMQFHLGQVFGMVVPGNFSGKVQFTGLKLFKTQGALFQEDFYLPRICKFSSLNLNFFTSH